MDARKLMLPAAVLVGGAVLGRLIGFKGLVRAGLAALTFANVSQTAGLLTAGKRASGQRAKPARRRSAAKRSTPRKASRSATVPAGTQTH
jgi:hypothetical protein